MPHAKGKLKPGETMPQYRERARAIHARKKPTKKMRRAAVAKVRAGY